MTTDFIRIRGARQHNLKNLSLDLPRNKLVVITGLSGSGKSSLAFDTIYAEGKGGTWNPSRLCAPVPGADGQTGCGFHRGPLSRHFH